MFEKRASNTERAAPENPVSPQESPAPTSVASPPRASAVIGSTIIIKGEISGDENLIIEGKVEGTVDLGSKHVTVGQSGSVQANIEAQVIKVEGEVKGDMSGREKVVVSKTGKVQGNIVAPRVTLEDGAKFKGSIDMDPSDKGAMESPVTPIKSAGKAAESSNAGPDGSDSTKPAKNG